jgi:multiple sugar transport system substrate-binding protein
MVLNHAAGGLAAAAVITRATAGRSQNASIDILHAYSGADHPMNKVIEAFNARATGVTAVGRQEGTTYEAITQKMMTAIGAGRPAAIMTTGWKLASFAKRTLGARDLAQTYGAAAETLFANFAPAVRQMVTVENTLIGLPWALSTPVLYVNLDLWRQAGLSENDMPATVEQLHVQARQIQERTGKAGLIHEISEWVPQAFIQNAGGDVLDAQGRAVMDSEAAIIGMNKFIEPRQLGIWRPVNIAEMVTAFQSGAVGMMTTSSARLSGIRAQARFAVRMAEMPGIEDRPRRMNSGGNFLAVYAREREQQQAALAFLNFCASREAIAIWLDTGYLNTSLHQLPIPDGHEASYAQLARGLTPETIWPGSRGLEALTAHIDWITRMVNGAVSVADGLRGSREAVARLIAA